MGGETEKDSWVYVTWVCLLFCQKSPDGEPGVTLLFWWQRVLCGFSPAQGNILSLELVGKLYFTIQSLMVEPMWQGYTCSYLGPQLIGSPRCGFSNLPYDVTTEQALTYPEVKNKLEASIENLRRVTDKVLSSIISSLDLLP